MIGRQVPILLLVLLTGPQLISHCGHISSAYITWTQNSQNAGVEISLLSEEWKDMLDYDKFYRNFTCYLFSAACSSKWSNIFVLVEHLSVSIVSTAV